jgi:nucleoside-diphosphate-sugar epimerase
MHVEDFCSAVIQAINSNVRNEHFNISAQNPMSTLEIISTIQDITGKYLEDTIKWYPNTDYLGNHRLSNKKFIKYFGDINFKCLKQGIKEVWNEINSNKSGFNPLKYLEEAKEKYIDLTKFFPKD